MFLHTVLAVAVLALSSPAPSSPALLVVQDTEADRQTALAQLESDWAAQGAAYREDMAAMQDEMLGALTASGGDPVAARPALDAIAARYQPAADRCAEAFFAFVAQATPLLPAEYQEVARSGAETRERIGASIRETPTRLLGELLERAATPTPSP